MVAKQGIEKIRELVDCGNPPTAGLFTGRRGGGQRR